MNPRVLPVNVLQSHLHDVACSRAQVIPPPVSSLPKAKLAVATPVVLSVPRIGSLAKF
jgi:hypothetical protein